MAKTYYVIPARAGSKGLPGKNRLLLDYTLSQLPQKYYGDLILTTDDSFIRDYVSNKFPSIKLHCRSEHSARDEASTKECLLEVVRDCNLNDDDTMVMLYLTYPNRSWLDIKGATAWFLTKKASSLLCKEEATTHPYMCIYDKGDKGEQVVEHNLYRRQDYPECSFISWMVSIFSVSELDKLNNNLYNENTVYYKIDHSLDVDTLDDFNKISF
tara:strand:+ start:6745 stop:7383 length:639 start_codon:yes stop_codon:yes gene_type:complete